MGFLAVDIMTGKEIYLAIADNDGNISVTAWSNEYYLVKYLVDVFDIKDGKQKEDMFSIFDDTIGENIKRYEDDKFRVIVKKVKIDDFESPEEIWP